jgi:hypothetical protein
MAEISAAPPWAKIGAPRLHYPMRRTVLKMSTGWVLKWPTLALHHGPRSVLHGFNRGERRGLEKMGEKRRKKGEREKADLGNERRKKKKKKKKLKKWGQLIFFYLMKSYNNISFVKSYCSNLAI